ncbi:coiled-coil domain-containing protein 12 [Biomphalaria glabrata]|uniref:Coiled-coil domain-containing protein 12-like n=1 Tax=Biomphalaria glabrata TaxID=6526 RepID=A0A9U8ENN3_BIOGL|nr:coiled-coil domain-containing protein 12-like [Biomphalaria glabrata]KAI8744322.1 coiled-coil domain-containing protein 12-like [Biomphalaria glabrata]
MAAVGTLNDEALKRKERLKALRERQSAQSDAVQQEEEKETEKLPKPVFRSYKPESDRLKELSIQSAKPEDATKSIKEDMETGQTDHVVTDVDLSNLAPRKPDWDLKRDISKKLDKLERKTQRAIAELIRERLKASQEDLASVVMGEALTRNNTKNMT